jgi:hypothetical protein
MKTIATIAALLCLSTSALAQEKTIEQKPSTVAADQSKTKNTIKATFLGYASVVAYNPDGWTEQTVEHYIRQIKRYRERGELSSLGIPPSTPTSSVGLYAAGFIYLIDHELPKDSLQQFSKSKDPGYLSIAPHIKGYYQWSIFGDDRGVIGFRTEGFEGGGREYNHYRELFFNRHKK